jgi:uncharacterized phage protein (TIGR01671 family)
MREILFKAKRVANGKWVQGHYMYELESSRHLVIVTSHYSGDGRENPPFDFQTSYDVIPETVCQYTGQKDKDGNKVFEGDVLTSSEYPYQDEGERNYDAVVTWVYCSWQLVLRLVNDEKRGISDGINQGQIESLDGFKRLGNIHDKKK